MKHYKAKRWVVERSASWLNRFRKLLIRWEKKAENYLGLFQLACCIVVYRRTILGLLPRSSTFIPLTVNLLLVKVKGESNGNEARRASPSRKSQDYLTFVRGAGIPSLASSRSHFFYSP